MLIEGNKVEAIFHEKLNRFVGVVTLKGQMIPVHIPNSGRLRELLLPGARVILRESDNPKRKYQYSLVMVEKAGTLVSVDSLLPNKIVINAINEKSEILRRGNTSKLLSYHYVKPEVSYLNSRFDIGLGTCGDVEYYLEVKGVTLVEENRALFPDAPTPRGARHLRELAAVRRQGLRAGVFFVIQREDAMVFAPNDEMDPNFGQALREAATVGVDIFAAKCKIEPNEVNIIEDIAVILD